MVRELASREFSMSSLVMVKRLWAYCWALMVWTKVVGRSLIMELSKIFYLREMEGKG